MVTLRLSVAPLAAAVIVAAAAAVLLAGCSGSPTQQVGPPIAPQTQPQVKNHCTAHGGVRVTPCSVDLTASSSGPDSVTVRTPKNKKGSLSEADNCGGASGIATVTQGSGDSWIVTAGATTGSCTATFDFRAGKHDKVVGWADLGITNSI